MRFLADSGLTTLGTIGGLVLVVLGVVTLYLQLRDGARKRAEADRDERDALVRAAKKEGADSRNNEVALLESRLADAYHDRDEARSDAREWERRYNDLRDRRT